MEIVDLSKNAKVNALIGELMPMRAGYEFLAGKSQLELDFLSYIDYNRKRYYNEAFLKRSVIRYEKYWVPLLAKLSNTFEDDLKYAPPIDIHWAWHCHMLAPVSYAADCKKMVGRVLNHALRNLSQLVDLRENTKKHWQVAYPGVPFDVDLNTPDPEPLEADTSGSEAGASSTSTASSSASKISYNIVAAALRQGAFYYQVSLSHFRDQEFLGDAYRRYLMYLYLKKQNPEAFLVPCYDIDLMWHTHQVHPFRYEQDMRDILGFVLKHDDSVNDRSEGSKLNNADEITRKLWYNTFSVSFARPGSMFRGNPPEGKLHPLSETFQKSLVLPREIDVQVEKILIPADHPLPEVDGA